MMKNETHDGADAASRRDGKISPSAYMRTLRPEYYSDTQDRQFYVLDAPTLEYHLETLTQRNQTHDFEVFCRKLCERAICPNLRVQTGPEGGGDSKVDTETYPVADEISLRYVGEPHGGREKWAFAFSAKKTWSKKVRDDVRGIVATGRKYDKIICVTSRFARSRDRARIEQELEKEYGVPVIIHDRSWIVREIIENEREDLAANYLGVGESRRGQVRLGPTDYSRDQQLQDIEKSIADPDAFRGMERQLVTEALVAAKLSRNLERPRSETESRFDRAIRIANEHGAYRQKLESQYERLWTAYWWFDDFRLVNASYEAFEKMALKADHAQNLKFLCNLHQLLANSVVHGHMSCEECRLDERTDALRRALESMAKKTDRPNNSLEAQTSLLVIRLNSAILDRKPESLVDVWRDFAAILDRAPTLGEFDADSLVEMIEVAGKIAGNDPSYNRLVEKLSEFVAARKSEGEGALILLNRAQKLDFSDRFDMLRLLGKAAIGLTKKEYSDHLVDALHLLTLAYRGADLLWAARASCISVAATIVMKGEETSHVPVIFVPTMKIWAWIALELRHVPDFLFAIQMLNGALASLPLADESKTRVREDLSELDLAFGSVILNLSEMDLRILESVPDLLDALGLQMARSSLLYALGYEDLLRQDGSIPATETNEKVNELFSLLASQPVARQVHGTLIMNAEGRQTISTIVLGMTVEVTITGSLQSILIAEAILGTLEAFFATTIEHRIVPHTEKFLVIVSETYEVSQPSIEVKMMDMSAEVKWPTALSPASHELTESIRGFLVELCGQVLGATCIVQKAEEFLEKLFSEDALQHRIAMIAGASNGYNRVTSRSVSRLSDWQTVKQKTYALRSPRPELARVKVDGETREPEEQVSEAIAPKRHGALSIRSVVDVHAWNHAQWRGVCYVRFGVKGPPGIALLFANGDGGRKIFERWRERFGQQDTSEEIYLAVVRRVSPQKPHHYVVVVTSSVTDADNIDPDRMLLVANRSMTMEPNDDANLEGFLKAYREFQYYYLLPAVANDGDAPVLVTELAIAKRRLSVKDAAEVSRSDVESVALLARHPTGGSIKD